MAAIASNRKVVIFYRPVAAVTDSRPASEYATYCKTEQTYDLFDDSRACKLDSLEFPCHDHTVPYDHAVP